jgi:prepilin peptidase CpaA
LTVQNLQLPVTSVPASLEVEMRELMLPTVTAVAVVICLIQTASETPLPQIHGAAAFLFIAILTDVHRRRIPNWLTFPSLGLALGWALVGGGEVSGATAATGTVVALFVFGIPFACGFLGAGDVKAAMVLGALWGPGALLSAAWWMVVSGGVLAIAIVALQSGGLKDLVRRWSLSAWYTIRLRKLVYLSPNSQVAAAGGLPFAVAMGTGASAFQLWGIPWL